MSWNQYTAVRDLKSVVAVASSPYEWREYGRIQIGESFLSDGISQEGLGLYWEGLIRDARAEESLFETPFSSPCRASAELEDVDRQEARNYGLSLMQSNEEMRQKLLGGKLPGADPALYYRALIRKIPTSGDVGQY